MSTVRAVREAKEAQLASRLLERLRAMQRHRPSGGAPVDIRFETHTWSGPDLQALLDYLGKLK